MLIFVAYSSDTDNGNMKGYYIKVVKVKRKKWKMLMMKVNHKV